MSHRETDERPRGVTPALCADYSRRTALQQAAFLLPHLRPGLELLDMGCGPGTITVGLAELVAPGQVVGVDYDATHLEQAETRRLGAGLANLAFRRADARSLPFADQSFDIVFENNLLIHVAAEAARAVGEAYRVLRPGGSFAARDAVADAALWGPADTMSEFDELFVRWHTTRGSDVTLGRRLPALLAQAGFAALETGVSADLKSERTDIDQHVATTLSLLDGPFGHDIMAQGWADRTVISRLRDAVRRWADQPAAYFANLHVEVIGRRPDRE